jgi:hypothetical protein
MHLYVLKPNTKYIHLINTNIYLRCFCQVGGILVYEIHVIHTLLPLFDPILGFIQIGQEKKV